MTVVDLHPEELLDKDARDELTDDERVRLDAHLARCSACRAERLLRADFADELEGEDRPSAILGLVKGALAAPEASPKVSPESPEESRELDEIPGLARLRRPRRRTMAVLLVAAAILAASAAGATGLTTRVWMQIRGNAQEATHSSASSSSTSAPVGAGRTVAGGPGRAVPGAADVAPPAEDVASGSPIDTNPASDPAPAPIAAAPAMPVAASPAMTAAVVVAPVLPPVSAPVAAAPAAPPATVAAAPTSAAALFDSANTARRTGDTNGALARYEALDTQFPGSREARVAKATAGRLLLDRGDAAGALSRFDAYLASGSTELREEAMAGRATALERLGRDDDETRAWAALLATYPSTPYAAHAKARVGRSLPR